MTTQITNPLTDLETLTPVRRGGAPLWAGRISLVLALVSLVLLCLNDPASLVMPGSIAAILLGIYALRRGPRGQACAHLGLNLGLMNVMLWLVVILILRYLLDVDLSLFDVPNMTP